MNPTMPASRATGAGVDHHDALPDWLVPHRDLGPLEGALARPGRIPLPQVVGALLATAVLSVPVVAASLSGGIGQPGTGDAVTAPVGPAWAWAAAAVGITTVAMAGRSLARFDWPLPALLRAIEYGTVLVLAAASAWSYLLLAVLAAHHYGIVYRVRLSDTGSPQWVALATGGWPVRCGAVVIAAATGTVEAVVMAMALVLTPIVGIDAVMSWRRLGR